MPSMTSGRLDEELRRMSAIADQIGPGCLMLFNESFAGDQRAGRIRDRPPGRRALLDAGIKVFFVTHRFGFAEHFHRQRADSTLFLRAERQPDGRRNYKLAVEEPLPTSYGEDLYYRSADGWRRTNPFIPIAAAAAADGGPDGSGPARQAGQIGARAPGTPGAG